MKVVAPSAEVYFHYPNRGRLDPSESELFTLPDFLERVGRTCYKSEDRMTADSAGRFIEMLTKRGHGAMLEHCFASVKFVCDRGVSHELVRHRIASYAQESTRYCNYTANKFDGQVTTILPPFKNAANSEQVWTDAWRACEAAYTKLIENGEPPELARSVLPNSLKTEIWCTTNLREWQHIFGLRCAATAHPQIREVMLTALAVFADEVPPMFQALWEKYGK